MKFPRGLVCFRVMSFRPFQFTGFAVVGVGILVGLWMRVAAVAGMALSFGLFLTVTFHSSPYFTGSDIVFVFAWMPFILAGAAGAPALDTWLASPRHAVSGEMSSAARGVVSRRSVVSVGSITAAVAGAVVVLGGAAAAVGRAVGGAPPLSSGERQLSSLPPVTSSTGATTATTVPSGGSHKSGSTPKGTVVGAAASVPVGGSAAFTDPKTGDPSLVIQQKAGDFVAYDAICPHEGCTVAYQAASRIIACPCHGSEFNPKDGNVVRGPAPYGLTPIGIAEGPNGDLYVRS